MALDDVKGDDRAAEGLGPRRAQFCVEMLLRGKIGLGTTVIVGIDGLLVFQIAAGQINEWIGDA